MTGRKALKTGIGIAVAGILLFAIAVLRHQLANWRTLPDEPRNLSDKTETVTLAYINWACDCANFVETKYIGNYTEDSCIFIEPASRQVAVPAAFYDSLHFSKDLRLWGSFYTVRGIPKSYEQKTPERPEKARVFRYTSVEMVNR